jgi:pilus assembly protein CpaB
MAERRYTVVFGVAVLVASAATFGVWRVLQSAEARNRVATVNVVVATRDIPEGNEITRDMLGTSTWPAGNAPAGAFQRMDSVAGRVTRVPVFKGEPIVPGRLAPMGTGPGLEVKISPGKRAMAVRINDVAGISGLIQPNSRVDVLVTMRSPDGGRQNQVAKLFMENMRVLSVGTNVQRGDDGMPVDGKTATLEVTPDEAERLAVAQGQGTIQLVLRGYGDPDSINTSGASSSDVLAALRDAPSVSQPVSRPPPRRTTTRPTAPKPDTTAVVATPPPQPVLPQRPDTSVVKIYRGNDVTTQKFEKDTTKRPPER